MKILVLNCGSSSIKYQLLEMEPQPELLAKGLVERVGLEMGEFTHKPVGKDKYYTQTPIPNHEEGIKLVLKALTDPTHGVINSLDEINAVGHRVAHGGEYFKESCVIGDKEREEISKLCALAPLHNPASLTGIDAMKKLLSNVKHVGVFDTSFHQTMPPEAFLYALPFEYYSEKKIRRYGFHGTSHKYVGPKAAEIAGIPYEKAKIVSCHLGNGASICAIKDGKSIDTSMGFTPVEGLVMGTRVGDLDAGALLYIMDTEGLNTKEMELSNKLWAMLRERRGQNEEGSLKITWLNIVGYCIRHGMLKGPATKLCKEFYPKAGVDDYKAINKGKKANESGDLKSFAEIEPLLDRCLKPKN